MAYWHGEPVESFAGACWVSPDGEVVPVGVEAHHRTAEDILARTEKIERRDAVRVLVGRGWMALGEGGWSNYSYILTPEPTQAQLDVLWDLAVRARAQGNERFAGHLQEEFFPIEAGVEA